MELYSLNSSAGMKTAVPLTWQHNKACNAAMQRVLAWLRKSIYTVLGVMQASTDLGSVSSAFWEVMLPGSIACSSWCWNTQHVWLGDRGEDKGDQCLQSHHAVSTPAHFSFSQIRHRALGIANILKAALSVPYSLTMTTSFLSSSMSLSFFPFFFPPCSDVAVGSYLSLPACKGRHSIIRNILQIPQQ